MSFVLLVVALVGGEPQELREARRFPTLEACEAAAPEALARHADEPVEATCRPVFRGI